MAKCTVSLTHRAVASTESPLWPALAEYFGMEVGPVRTVRLSHVMSDKGDTRRQLIDRYSLHPPPYEQAALWSYGDFVFTPGWDIMSDTTKARQHGFQEVLDTEQMFIEAFDHIRQMRLIPPHWDES